MVAHCYLKSSPDTDWYTFLYHALQIQSNILKGVLKNMQTLYFFRILEPAKLLGCYHSDFSPKNIYSTIERKKKHNRKWCSYRKPLKTICPNPIAYPLCSLRRTSSKADTCSRHRVPPDSGPRVITHVMVKQDFLSRNFYQYRQLLLKSNMRNRKVVATYR